MSDPIQPPPNNPEKLAVWYADVVSRIRTLFESYGLEPVDIAGPGSTWRELAIRLAIQHDPEFRLSINPLAIKLPSQKKLDVIARQSLMDDEVNFEIARNADTGEPVEVRRDRPLPVRLAANRLRSDLIRTSALRRLANEASSMASDYSRRMSGPGELFGELLDPYIDYFRTISAIQNVAQGVELESLAASLQGNDEIKACASSLLAARIGFAAP